MYKSKQILGYFYYRLHVSSRAATIRNSDFTSSNLLLWTKQDISRCLVKHFIIFVTFYDLNTSENNQEYVYNRLTEKNH